MVFEHSKVFLLVPAYPCCPGTKAVIRLLLLLFQRDILNPVHVIPHLSNVVYGLLLPRHSVVIIIVVDNAGMV